MLQATVGQPDHTGAQWSRPRPQLGHGTQLRLVTVKYLGTEENTADIFTKILDRQPFEKHRKTVLNAAANDGVPSARDKKAMGAWPRRF